jgi:predicted transcriptional regulator
MKTDTGHARSNLANLRQKAVRVFCAKRNIYKRDFAVLAGVSLSTLYRFLRGENLFGPFEYRIKEALKGVIRETV